MTHLTAGVWSKPQTQSAIKALRNAGLTVNKDCSGAYHCEVTNKQTGVTTLLLKALPGERTYLVRYAQDLFV